MYASYETYNGNNPEESRNPTEQEQKERLSFDLVDGESFKKALEHYEIIVVDAWAPWCNPCKKAGEKFEKLGKKHEKHLRSRRLLLLKDNIDDETSIHKNSVHVVPSFFLYVRGKLLKIFSGVEYQEFEEHVDEYCNRL